MSSLLDRYSPDQIRDLLADATPGERADIELALDLELVEGDPLVWAPILFPESFPVPFAEHHADFWAWVWAIEPDSRPHPFVGIWPRGGAKSTSAEAACVALGARKIRRYALYVCATQDQADDHVGNIGTLLESKTVERLYPNLATRALGKYGNSKGWRRNRLRTADGFTVDAIGLDSATRGAKVDEDRPDLIVIDDVDESSDTAQTTEKKIDALTKKLLPAGSNDLAVIAIQNLVSGGGVFAQLADGRAEFLADRQVSGPIPALRDLASEQGEHGIRLTSGTPSWEGQDLDRCQEQVQDWGFSAFMSEAQHDVTDAPGGMYDHLTFRHCNPDEVPDLVQVTLWVDPAVTDTDQSDSQAMQCDGISSDGTIYRLFSWEQRSSPQKAVLKAIEHGVFFGARIIGIETDQGGDTWGSVYREASDAYRKDNPGAKVPRFASDKAGSKGPDGKRRGSKAERSQRMLNDYERGRVVHVIGTHETLERGLRRFPRTKPFDLADAAYWSWDWLRSHSGRSATYGARNAQVQMIELPKR